MCWFLSVYLGLRTCSDSTTPSYLDVSGWLAGGMLGRLAGGMLGDRDLLCCFYHAQWQLLGGRYGWKDCCCGPAASAVVAPPVQLLQGQPARRKKEGVGPLLFMPVFSFAKVRHSWRCWPCNITPETATEQSILEIDLLRNALAPEVLLDIHISWFLSVCTSFTASSYLLRSVLTRSLQAV